MGLEVRPLAIDDVLLIETKTFGDSRGSFCETYNRKAFAEAGIVLDFVQDNHARSRERGTIRGLHYQMHPFAQDKLVRVVSGRILDVAVDIRRSSPTFGQTVTAQISAYDGLQILVPAGFAHGYCTLEPDTQIIYKVSDYYAPQHEFGIRWNDPDLNIDWPVADADAHLSDKDRKLPLFAEVTQWL